jgi:preprotein translocase subunit YajC
MISSFAQQLAQVAPFLIVFVLFYVLLILPMRKRQKAVQQMVETLKKGDRVITSGGMYGEIYAVMDGAVMLKIADNLKVKVAKSAITGLEPEGEKGATS